MPGGENERGLTERQGPSTATPGAERTPKVVEEGKWEVYPGRREGSRPSGRRIAK